MTEIRPVRSEKEAELFLQLLCDVFGLEFGRAYDVFFREPFFDLRRKWAMFEGGAMVSVLTTTPLEFGWGRAVGIAGVATVEGRRREGLAGRLLERVLRESERDGEGPALLFAAETGVYERQGFEILDRVIRAPLPMPLTGGGAAAEWTDLVPIYEAWSSADPARLRRDDRRWSYWRWHYRQAVPIGRGYVCHENGLLREGLWHRDEPSLPLPEGTDWLGLTNMADLLGLRFERAREEVYLLGRNFPGVPQMFMTDQF